MPNRSLYKGMPQTKDLWGRAKARQAFLGIGGGGRDFFGFLGFFFFEYRIYPIPSLRMYKDINRMTDVRTKFAKYIVLTRCYLSLELPLRSSC